MPHGQSLLWLDGNSLGGESDFDLHDAQGASSHQSTGDGCAQMYLRDGDQYGSLHMPLCQSQYFQSANDTFAQYASANGGLGDVQLGVGWFRMGAGVMRVHLDLDEK